MNWLLFTIYLLLFTWIITRTGFMKRSGIPSGWLAGLFVVKVVAGIAYGWYYEHIPNYLNEADTWKFYFESLDHTKLLKQNPIQFFTSMFHNPEGRSYGHLFSPFNSYWNDLKHLYMVKLVALFNFLSGSHYYTNIIFYNYLTFFGPVALVRLMDGLFPNRLRLITITSFLFPSFLFWSSGIHKDGIVFTLLLLATYLFHQGLRQQQLGWKRLALVAVLIGLIFPVRNHIVLACIPGFTAWWLAEKYFKEKWIAFALVSVVFGTAFFTTKYIHPKANLPISIVMRNKEFTKLGGNSFLPQRPLESTFPSFLKNAPQALNHTLVRPYITEVISPLYLVSALEILLVWLLVFTWFFRFTENPYRHSVVLFLFLVSMVLLLLTGYIVPQLGAIVRYRSIYFPLVLVPIMATIRWPGFILKFFRFER